MGYVYKKRGIMFHISTGFILFYSLIILEAAVPLFYRIDVSYFPGKNHDAISL